MWKPILLLLALHQSDCSAIAPLPPGTLIELTTSEPLVAGVTAEGETVLLDVAEDVRLFPRQRPLIPASSKVLARVRVSRPAGRMVGRARLHLEFLEILTPDWCRIPIRAKLVAVNGRRVEQVILGRGHPKRDAFLLLFPLTTVYQILRLPARGPQLRLPPETTFTIKIERETGPPPPRPL